MPFFSLSPRVHAPPQSSNNKHSQDGLSSTLNIHTPTDVQSAAIPLILQGDNIAVQCYTGSGKTLAYLLPILSMAITRSEEEWSRTTRKTIGQAGTVQAVVVAPSRELAMQIVRVAESLLPHAARRAVQQCIGGANIHRQRDALKTFKPILVVGTPGRLSELSRDGSLQTHRCGILVLDEADQLLAPQFREEMTRVTEHTGKKVESGRQTILVSATLTPRVMSLCEPWCPCPVPVFVGAPPPSPPPQSAADEEGRDGGTLDSSDGRADDAEDEHQHHEGDHSATSSTTIRGNAPAWGWGSSFDATQGSAGGYGNRDAAPAIAPGLTHLYVVAPAPQHRVDTLRRAIHAVNAQRALVFMNFQQRLRDAEGKLAARKMSVGSLHGEMTKQERQNTLKTFRGGKYRALLVSDVVARGLDVEGCDAVFNLELPTDAAHYAHRAGRTGRAGKGGVVVSVITENERFVMEKLSKRLQVKMEEVHVSHGDMMVMVEDGDGNGEGEEDFEDWVGEKYFYANNEEDGDGGSDRLRRNAW